MINAQSDSVNRREQRPFGISVNVLGPTIVAAVNIDYFFSKNFSIEAGAGVIGCYGGIKTYFGKKTWVGMPYVGATFSTIFFNGDDGGAAPFFYFPVGYHYVGKKGLNLSLEVATTTEPFLFYGQFRIGHRFLKKKKD